MRAFITDFCARGEARHVARYLDPKDKSQKVYQRIADALGGRGMMRMM